MDWTDELDEDCRLTREGCPMGDECGVQGVRPGQVQCDHQGGWYPRGEHPHGPNYSGWGPGPNSHRCALNGYYTDDDE